MEYLNEFDGIEEFSSNTRNVLHIINKEGRISVANITDQLKISESTVRRILLFLEEKKIVKRYHGGASIVHTGRPELPVYQRDTESANEKREIAKAAAAHVGKGDRIFLAGGTSVAAMCEFVKDIPDLTVVTDSLLVIRSLMYERNIRLISLGGILNMDEQCFEGILTSANIKLLRLNKIFVGITGIDVNDGFLINDLSQVDLYRSCTSGAELIIVASSDKFYREGIMSLYLPSEVDLLVTNRKAPPDIVQQLESNGCRTEFAKALDG